jgi:uncharacterized cupredoxin-like copper-binding protein
MVCLAALVTRGALAQAGAGDAPAAHPGHGAGDVTAPAGLDPLRDAGVAMADREKALAGKGATVAEAAWKSIEACDACLAANDLAALLATRPEAELTAIAPAMAATLTGGSAHVRAAAARALCALPADKRPDAAKALQPIALKTASVVGKMSWDPKEFTVEPGALVSLRMDNPDSMQHNMLVTVPGALSEIGVAADKLGEGMDGKRRQFVPDSPKVLFVMGLVAPGQSGEMWFFAPEKPGTYPLVCTFPGHWRMMNGKLKVAKKG